MSPFSARLGAVAGWLTLLGLVVGLIIVPAMIAGQEPASAAPPSELRAYFAHPELAVLNGYLTGFVAVGFVAFGLGLRVILSAGTDRDHAFADIGMALLVIAMGLNLASGALVATLVDGTSRAGADLVPLARLHDVTFNGLGDVLEGAWIGAFSIAMLSGTMPRWIGWYGIVLAVAHLLKAIGPFIALPEMLDQVFGPLIVIWFLATVVSLTRIAFKGVGSSLTRPAVPA